MINWSNVIAILNIAQDMEQIINIAKMVLINIFTYYTFSKITSVESNSKMKSFIIVIMTCIISIVCSVIKYKVDYLTSILLYKC